MMGFFPGIKVSLHLNYENASDFFRSWVWNKLGPVISSEKCLSFEVEEVAEFEDEEDDEQ